MWKLEIQLSEEQAHFTQMLGRKEARYFPIQSGEFSVYIYCSFFSLISFLFCFGGFWVSFFGFGFLFAVKEKGNFVPVLQMGIILTILALLQPDEIVTVFCFSLSFWFLKSTFCLETISQGFQGSSREKLP